VAGLRLAGAPVLPSRRRRASKVFEAFVADDRIVIRSTGTHVVPGVTKPSPITSRLVGAMLAAGRRWRQR
jgi:hypothetical protein